LKHFGAKFEYGLGAPAKGAAHGLAKILVENSGGTATVIQKPRAQGPKCITQGDANFGAQSTVALPL
jgi:hypothetical protein